LEDEQTPHPKKKKKKKTIPDIFCNYVFVFQRQVEQLIQRRHGCHETKRDTEIMKIERERERERREAKKLFSFAGSATAQTANAEKKPNNNQGRR
jgi:hypothetical protein